MSIDQVVGTTEIAIASGTTSSTGVYSIRVVPPATGSYEVVTPQIAQIAIAVSIRACLARQRVQLATATEWVARLAEHKRQGTLETELRRLAFIPLIVVDEVGYMPADPEAPTSCSASSPAATSARR